MNQIFNPKDNNRLAQQNGRRIFKFEYKTRVRLKKKVKSFLKQRYEIAYHSALNHLIALKSLEL